jgi:hypothetical protein
MFLNKQIYAAGYRVTNWLRELSDFYEQISNLLILDTYFINDIDPILLKTLEENIHPYAGEIESEDIDSLLSALYCIKQQILETSKFKRCQVNMCLHEF